MAKNIERPVDLNEPKHALNLIGYEQQEAEIFSRIQTNRLPQAIMITGNKGVGKATFAYRIARYLLSYSATPVVKEAPVNLFGEPDEPADTLALAHDHPVVRRVSAGSHPDILIIEPEFDDRKKEYKSEISVEMARKIPEFMSLTPAESLWRVVIIDSVDELNRNASNAILKILEEPPARSLLLLVSHNPSRLLPTIRSRCQVLALPRLSADRFFEIFRGYDLKLPKDDEMAYGEISAYSPGHAYDLWQQDALKAYRDLMFTLKRFPSIRSSVITDFTEEWCKREGLKRWKMLCWVLDTMFARIMKMGVDEDLKEIFTGELLQLEILRKAKPLDYWFQVWEKATHLCAETTHIHLDKKLVLFQIFQMMQDEHQLAA